MRRFSIVLIVLAALTVGAVPFASGAGASVPAASAKEKKFCNAVTGISGDVGDNSGGVEQFEDMSKALKKAAKSAPNAKIKSAVNTLADYYEALVDGDADALQDNGKAFGKATLAFSGFMLGTCALAGS